MRLNEAIELAKECGLTTVGEALLNIRIHALSLFKYGEEKKEILELINDFKESGLTSDSIISFSQDPEPAMIDCNCGIRYIIAIDDTCCPSHIAHCSRCKTYYSMNICFDETSNKYVTRANEMEAALAEKMLKHNPNMFVVNLGSEETE